MHCLSTQLDHELNPAVLFFQEIPLSAQIFSGKRKDKGDKGFIISGQASDLEPHHLEPAISLGLWDWMQGVSVAQRIGF